MMVLTFGMTLWRPMTRNIENKSTVRNSCQCRENKIVSLQIPWALHELNGDLIFSATDEERDGVPVVVFFALCYNSLSVRKRDQLIALDKGLYVQSFELKYRHKRNFPDQMVRWRSEKPHGQVPERSRVVVDVHPNFLYTGITTWQW
jgi:hypothetical protein